MLRLFETGHHEEARMLDNLEAIGVTVRRVDPATSKQWACSNINGHFRGHADGVLSGLVEAPKTDHLFEAKTHSEKSFKELVSKGVALAKPGHYRQMQMYMHHLGLSRAFYLALNKNTDELYQERVAYDPVIAGQLVARAERIIMSDVPPPKLHDDPNSKMAFACKWCPHFGICHGGEMPKRRNCRTCLSSTPVDGGFSCDVFNQVNEPHLQRMGCSVHVFIPALVPGEQIDADPEKRTVTYKLRDGTNWTDGQVICSRGQTSEGGGGPLTDETDDAGLRETAKAEMLFAVKSSEPTEFSEVQG